MKIKLAFIIGVLAFGLLTGSAQEIVVTNVVTNTNVVHYVPADSIGSLNISPTLSHSLQDLLDVTAGSTNGAVILGGGRGLTGNKNFAFVDYLYNMNANAGLVIGYDYLFSNDKRMWSPSANVVKGGLNLQADIYPLRRFNGDTNSLFYTFKVTPFASVLILTPMNGTSSNNGGIGQATIAGGDWESPLLFNRIHLHLGGFYENRTGQGAWDGNYLALHFAASCGW